MKTKIILAFFLFVCLRAQARLGETKKEIEQRYGAPKEQIAIEKPAAMAWRYEKNGYEIEVQFVDGKSACETFFGEKDLSENEIALLLKSNAGDSSWPEREGFRVVRADGAVIAQIIGLNKALSIFAKGWQDAQDALKRAAESTALKGF